MIIDLEHLSDPIEFFCDICIVGTGAAGLTIASEMLKTHLKVILLESGGLQHEPKTQALYNVKINGLPHPGSTEGRFRIHGGSTTKWAGQALPLMPIDFEKRDWIPYSGWPITFDELTPYYRRANQFLLVDAMNFDTDLYSYLEIIPPAFDRDKVHYHFSKWSPTPNIRENYFLNIKKSINCTLLLHANVTKIELEQNLQCVSYVKAYSLTKNQVTVRAKNFVLCTGGIESARLLLSNKQQQPTGIGNDHDLVGRFFQDHPSTAIGFLKTSNPQQTQRLFNVFHKHKLKYAVRCTASPQWQHQNQTLNISTGINFLEEETAFHDLKSIYRALRHRHIEISTLRQITRVILSPAASLSPIAHYFLRGRNYIPGAKFKIGLTSEQEPNPESRILLSEQQDALGVPLSQVKWKLSDLTQHSIQQFATTLQNEFRNTHIGEIKLESWIFENSSTWKTYVTDQFHHMGTTRMHDSPRQGVVDRHCRVHGLENLYIGSSAVFPTSGHSNPTLTIIALCMRLSDRLKNQMQTS